MHGRAGLRGQGGWRCQQHFGDFTAIGDRRARDRAGHHIDAVGPAMRHLAHDLANARGLGQIVRKMPHGWTNRIDVVTGTIAGTPVADGREITEVLLASPTALPPQTSAAVHQYLALKR